MLRPEIAALSMSRSSFLVAMNALMFKRLRLRASTPATPGKAPAAAEPAPILH
jgi:Cu2+-exporting ATPase